MQFKYDLSKDFCKIYTGELADWSASILGKRDLSGRNEMIGDRLSRIVPALYSKVGENLTQRLNGMYGHLVSDAEKCTWVIAQDESPIVVYDLGCMGDRPNKIIKRFNSIADDNGYDKRIGYVSLVDISPGYIDDAVSATVGKSFIPARLAVSELSDFALCPVYEELSSEVAQVDIAGYHIRSNGNSVQGSCYGRFNPGIILNLGRTINNVSDPKDLLLKTVSSMSPLDLLVVEGRVGAIDAVLYKSELNDILKAHASINLGLKERDYGGDIRFVEDNNDLYAFVELVRDVEVQDGDTVSRMPKGSDVLMFANRALVPEEFMGRMFYQDCGVYPVCVDLDGGDGIFYFAKHDMIDEDFDTSTASRMQSSLRYDPNVSIESRVSFLHDQKGL